MLAAELIGFVVLRSWLLDGVDQWLADFRPAPAFLDTRRPGEPEPGALPSDFRVYFYDARGNRLLQTLGSDDRQGPGSPTASTVSCRRKAARPRWRPTPGTGTGASCAGPDHTI
ncbi:hypothetical protein [Streptomyces sp. KL2]|uniref:hypothetical protein n=1 Tax=Streptomyces sp. KL2 TaxID=3050126 RepID=UPI00397CB2DC